MTALPLAFTSGWASGLNSYGVWLVLGLLGRYGHEAKVPSALERTDVLVVVGALFLLQFVAGKIPYVDSVWDVVHTPIRPVMAGALGAMMAHQGHGSLASAVAASAVGGGTALVSHMAKTGVRMGVNVSPEPFSNIAASLAEDSAVAGLLALAVLHPVAAAVIAAVLLVLMIIMAVLLVRSIRTFLRRRRERRPTRADVPRSAWTGL
jgi:hypothetical protein